MEIRDYDIVDLEVRDDGDEGFVSGRVVPFDTAARIGPDTFEEIRVGAFGEDPEPVPLRLEHGEVIGRSTRFENRDDGLYGEFKISNTVSGRDVKTLLRDGALSRFSIGFIPGKTTRKGESLVRVSADLKEVSIVGIPAYAGAAVTEVRKGDSERVHMPEKEEEVVAVTAALDVDELRAQIVDEVRKELIPDIPIVEDETTGSARPAEFRSFGDLILDVADAFGKGDNDALARVAHLRENGMLEMGPQGSTLIDLRAFTGTDVGTTADATGLLTAQSDFDLVGLVREGRPFANSLQQGRLIATGLTFTGPSMDQGTTIDYHAENATVSAQKVTTSAVTIPIPRLAGGQGYSTRVRDRSNPNYATEVAEDLVRAYSEKLDFETINGDGTDNGGSGNAGEHTGVLNWTGVGTATFDSASPKVSEFYAVLGSASAAVYIGHNQWPDYMAMHPRRWGWFSGASDANERPLLPPANAFNPAGTGNVRSVGSIGGIPVILDRNIPTDVGVGTEDVIIVYASSAARVYENSPSPVQLMLTYPDTLNVDISVHGDSAFRVRRPAGISIISGTGLIAP